MSGFHSSQSVQSGNFEKRNRCFSLFTLSILTKKKYNDNGIIHGSLQTKATDAEHERVSTFEPPLRVQLRILEQSQTPKLIL